MLGSDAGRSWEEPTAVDFNPTVRTVAETQQTAPNAVSVAVDPYVESLIPDVARRSQT